MQRHSCAQARTIARFRGSPPASRSQLYARFTRRQHAAYRRGACHILRKPRANATPKRSDLRPSHETALRMEWADLGGYSFAVSPTWVERVTPVSGINRNPCVRNGPVFGGA